MFPNTNQIRNVNNSCLFDKEIPTFSLLGAMLVLLLIGKGKSQGILIIDCI